MNSDWLLIGRRVIEKEAKALGALVDQMDESFVRACELIFACRGTVLLTGIGKSGIVARKWASTFSSTGTKSYFVSPAEAPHGDMGVIRPEDILVALSYSGETEELGHVLRHARESAIKIVGVTGNPKSSLARQTDVVLSVYLSEEACPLGLAPTTSTTLMMALGDALAVTLMQMRGFTERDFARLHPGGSLGRRLWLRVEELMHQGEEIPVVRLSDKLDGVLVEMTRKCLGFTVVMDADNIAGVITDGDLRRHFQRKGVAAGTNAADLMTHQPKTILREALAFEAREKMEKDSIQQLIVVDKDGKLVGALHLHDLLRRKVV